MAKHLALIAVLALAGCARQVAGLPGELPPTAAEAIEYETGPCFGVCPVFRISVAADGKGLFVGMRNTAVSGERAFVVTPEQYRAFAGRLAPYRPAAGDRVFQPGSELCGQTATDMPSVDVHWRAPRQVPQRLFYYYGCDREKNRAMASALGDAIDALPQVNAMVGDRP